MGSECALTCLKLLQLLSSNLMSATEKWADDKKAPTSRDLVFHVIVSPLILIEYADSNPIREIVRVVASGCSSSGPKECNKT